MPVLENQRHELFCQAIAKGETISKAYQNAGFRAHRGNAARLRADERVRARVLELQVAGARTAEITIASLLDELEHARQRADSLGQLSASVRAISEKARLAGLVVERQEIAIVDTEPEPQSTTEVLASVLERVGEKAARALAEAFDIEFDEAAIRAFYNGSNGSQASTRAVEWLPPRPDRKRELG